MPPARPSVLVARAPKTSGEAKLVGVATVDLVFLVRVAQVDDATEVEGFFGVAYAEGTFVFTIKC